MINAEQPMLPAPGDVSEPGAADLIKWDVQYRLMVEHIPAITYVAALDAQSSTLYTSPQIERVLGFTQAEWMADHTLWLKQVHPDDRPLVLTGLARSQAGEVAPCEYRMFTRSGRVVRFRDESALQRDADGRPLYLYGVMLDITARKQLEAELVRVRRRLAQSQEDARRRIAADLHDGTVQQLLGIGYLLDEQQRRLDAGEAAATQTDDAAQMIAKVRGEMHQAVVQLRQAIGELRVVGLDELGLRAALEAYLERLMNERDGDRPAIELDMDADRGRLPAEIAHCLFRVVQEALRNALRHARARQIKVCLRLHPGEALLEVRDDGCGFQVPAQLDMLVLDGHFGLVGLAEQVAWVGGQLDVRAQPGAGTSVLARVSLESRDIDSHTDAAA
jgi:PAS domain S-box-containing protein